MVNNKLRNKKGALLSRGKETVKLKRRVKGQKIFRVLRKPDVESIFIKDSKHNYFLKLINEFIGLKYNDGCSVKTCELYRRTIKRFLLVVDKEVTKITYNDVFNWLKKNFSKKKDSTYKTNLEILRSFFQFCLNKGYIEKIPIKKWWSPRIHRKQPNYLNYKEVQRLLIIIEKEVLRDRLIFLTLLKTGIRRTELCRLNVEDVEPNRIHVIGKGNKPRTVKIPYELGYMLNIYIANKEKGAPVFTSKGGDRISHENIYRIIRKIGEKGLLTGNLSPHRLRHTYATYRLSKGDKVEEIQSDLGHEFTEVTLLYATITNEEFIKQFKNYME